MAMLLPVPGADRLIDAARLVRGSGVDKF